MVVSAHPLVASDLSQAGRTPVSLHQGSRDVRIGAMFKICLLKGGHRPERGLNHLPIQAELRKTSVGPSNVLEQPFGQ